ncbi:hypothetical protein AAC387_Pa11g1948 [Persea americana]
MQTYVAAGSPPGLGNGERSKMASLGSKKATPRGAVGWAPHRECSRMITIGSVGPEAKGIICCHVASLKQ